MIPSAPRGIPLIGHALPLLRDPLGFVRSMSGYELARIRVGPFKAVMVCSPRLVREILHNDATFDKGGPLYDLFREVIGNGLGTCPHTRHQRQRKLVQPAFSTARFPAYTKIMTDQTVATVDAWRGGQELDVVGEMLALTTRTLVRTMFSDALSPATTRQAVADLSTFSAGMYQQAIMPSFLKQGPLAPNRRYREASARLHDMLNRVVTERRASGAEHDDLLSALLSARIPRDQADVGGDALTQSEIIENTLNVFIGGTETTASALAWSLHLLALNPDIEERVHREVDAVLAGQPATVEHMDQLRLTGHVITEALRMYPPGWILTRSVTTDTYLDSQFLPAGTTVAFSPYMIHHRADIYPDPERFDPDRWDGTQRSAPHFIPFVAGARKCIGDQFGLTEATLALATITSRWRLAAIPGQKVRPALAGTLRPVGLRLRATSRTPALNRR